MSEERKVKPQEPTVIVYTKAAEDKKIAKAGTEDTVHAVLAKSLVEKGFAELKKKGAATVKESSKKEEK